MQIEYATDIIFRRQEDLAPLYESIRMRAIQEVKINDILRIETTTNDVSFFKHRRKVEHRGGGSSMKNAPVKKTIHSLGIILELLEDSNWRYVSFISRLEDDSRGRKELGKVTRKVEDAGGQQHRGINFFLKEDI